LMTASLRQGCCSNASSASARVRALLFALAFALAFGDGGAAGAALAFAARRGRGAAAFAFALAFALAFPFAFGRAALVAGGVGASGAAGASAASPTWETFARRQRRLGLGSSSRGGSAEPDEVAPDAFNLLSFLAVFLVFFVPVFLVEEEATFPFFFFLSPLPLHPFFPFLFFLPFAFPSPRPRFLVDFAVSWSFLETKSAWPGSYATCFP
jgi:hypothetical protein